MWLLQRCPSADMPAEDLSLQFTFRQTYQPLSDLHAEKQTALFATIVTERAEESEPPRPSSVSPPRSLVRTAYRRMLVLINLSLLDACLLL